MNLSYSSALRMARELLGPKAWLKRNGTEWRIYVEDAATRTRTVYGEGESYLSALNDCFVLQSEVEAEARKKFGVLAPPESPSSEPTAPAMPEAAVSGT